MRAAFPLVHFWSSSQSQHRRQGGRGGVRTHEAREHSLFTSAVVSMPIGRYAILLPLKILINFHLD